MAHECHATNCHKHVPPEMFMCKVHWFMLPKSMRNRIWKHYREGQCDDWNPSKEYLLIAKECVIFIAQSQGIEPDIKLYDVFLEGKEK